MNAGRQIAGPLPTYARITAVTTRETVWWIGPAPWAAPPVGYSGDLPNTMFMEFQCCPDNGPTGLIEAVLLHMPRNPGDPSYTVRVSMDDDALDHLAEVHGFDAG